MVRQGVADADFCGKVPLHQTNLLQPHGYVLITDERFRIVQAGENIEPLLRVSTEEAVGRELAAFVGLDSLNALRERVVPGAEKLPFVLHFPAGPFLAQVKQQGVLVIFEVESAPVSQSADTFLSVFQLVKQVMAALEQTRSTQEVCEVAARELKRISGFDKVMIYQFDPGWNGDVRAEEMEEGMESYLGLKFPASDVPAQARELYKKTPYRLIPAVNYEPVRLFPVINPVTNAFTDLSDSSLRSVAGVHLEYLRNMKVEASMSTRILHEDRLWGLIACHHREPRYLSYELRAVFELLSGVISQQITAMINRDLFSFQVAKKELQGRLVESVFESRKLTDALLKNEQLLLQLLGATGVAVALGGRPLCIGEVPGEADLEDLIFWLQSASVTTVYHSPSLSKAYEPAEHYAAKASGLLALPLQPEKGRFVLCFRPEAVSEVSWGGNPNEAIQFEADGKKYHPRASFKQWQQVVTRTAQPWRTEELAVAEGFRNFIVEYLLNNTIS
jgi:chemotaxis family two-component system sensor kinase Cph1